jgi:hypothetical protein
MHFDEAEEYKVSCDLAEEKSKNQKKKPKKGIKEYTVPPRVSFNA